MNSTYMNNDYNKINTSNNTNSNSSDSYNIGILGRRRDTRSPANVEATHIYIYIDAYTYTYTCTYADV